MSQTDFNFQGKSIRAHGIVKWFNKKQGYGFIHVLTGEHKDKDLFVHYSNIRSTEPTVYKYLVQGEFVEFVVEKSNKENYEWISVDITGLYGQPTMCETRRNASLRDRDEDYAAEVDTRDHHRNRPNRVRRQTEGDERSLREDEEGYKRVVRGKTRKSATA